MCTRFYPAGMGVSLFSVGGNQDTFQTGIFFFPVTTDSVTRRITQTNHYFYITFSITAGRRTKQNGDQNHQPGSPGTSYVDTEIARRHRPGTRRNFTKSSYHDLPAIPQRRDSSTAPSHIGRIYGHHHRNRSNPSM